MGAARDSEVKGVWFVSARAYLVQRFGDEGVRRVAEGMPTARYRGALVDPLPSSWYPEDALSEALDSMLVGAASGDELRFLGMMRDCTDIGINRFFKAVARLTSPAFMLRRVPTMWSHIRRGAGQVEVHVREPAVVIEYSQFPYFARRTYQLMTEGSLSALMRVCTGHLPEIRVTDVGTSHLTVEIVPR